MGRHIRLSLLFLLELSGRTVRGDTRLQKDFFPFAHPVSLAHSRGRTNMRLSLGSLGARESVSLAE